MPFFDPIRIGASGAADTAFTVNRSLRYNPADITNLERTFGSAGNRRTWTFSFWTKRCGIGRTTDIFSPYRGGDGTQESRLFFQDSDQLRLYDSGGLSGYPIIRTAAVFRDIGAWYHFVVAVDTTQSTASNRVKMYANGVLQELDQTTYGNQNQQLGWNNNNIHRVGAYGYTAQGSLSSSNINDGYLAEVNFIDGQQLTPSSFGETNSDTGQWVPIDTSELTFGTNGFYLKFTDNSGTTATTLGKDSSGNGNNFTPNNFVTGDAVKDSPTNNFCTLSTLNSQNSNFSEGNLKAEITNGSGNRTAVATMGSKTGKWYYEVLYNSQVVDALCVGFGDESYNALQGNNKLFEDHTPSVGYYGALNGFIYYNTSRTEYSTDFTAGDIIGVAADFDNNQIYFYKNGTVHPNANPFSYTFSDTFFIPAMGNLTSGGNQTFTANFGQDSTFAGAKTAQGNTDANGIGDFYYSVPSGFKALCTANLPEPTILLPNNHFDTLLYTANGGTQNITGLNFNPDWVWGKSRSSAFYHDLYDTVRGDNLRIFSNDKNAEASGFLQFGVTGGFALSAGGNINDGTDSVVAWNWNAGDTDGVTYRVVVVSDSGNKFRFRNSANTATFAQSAVTLDLAEGGTYIFDGSDSTMASHPIVLAENSNGSPMYETGVTYELDGSAVANAAAYASGYASATTRRLLFTVPSSAPNLYYVCYNHAGMGGAINTNTTLGSSNFDGSTQSTVKANTTAGFSIVKYTGQQNASDTIGHGLGVTPQVVISKSRNSTYTYTQWYVYHHKLSTNYFLFLNLTNAQSDGLGDYYIDASFSSTVFAVGDDIYGPNVSSNNYIAYCFNEVAGYSKFGSYTGNGSTDGTFVFTGFRPALLIFKRSSSSGGSWRIFDNKRDTHNVLNSRLFPDSDGAEDTSRDVVDFLSNGFKLRANNSGNNNNGDTYIYLAFAESPFKNARAR